MACTGPRPAGRSASPEAARSAYQQEIAAFRAREQQRRDAAIAEARRLMDLVEPASADAERRPQSAGKRLVRRGPAEAATARAQAARDRKHAPLRPALIGLFAPLRAGAPRAPHDPRDDT